MGRLLKKKKEMTTEKMLFELVLLKNMAYIENLFKGAVLSILNQSRHNKEETATTSGEKRMCQFRNILYISRVKR